MLLILAVVFGLLAFVLTFQQLEREKQRIHGNTEQVVLIQINRNMVEGEVLTENDVVRYTAKRNKRILTMYKMMNRFEEEDRA